MNNTPMDWPETLVTVIWILAFATIMWTIITRGNRDD